MRCIKSKKGVIYFRQWLLNEGITDPETFLPSKLPMNMFRQLRRPLQYCLSIASSASKENQNSTICTFHRRKGSQQQHHLTSAPKRKAPIIEEPRCCFGRRLARSAACPTPVIRTTPTVHTAVTGWRPPFRTSLFRALLCPWCSHSCQETRCLGSLPAQQQCFLCGGHFEPDLTHGVVVTFKLHPTIHSIPVSNLPCPLPMRLQRRYMGEIVVSARPCQISDQHLVSSK